MTTRVLWVDDEDDIRTIVQFSLEDEADLALTLCASGAEALKAAAEQPFELVLLDVMMPGMDGPETFRRLRALPQHAATPVAFVTAKVQPQEVAQFKALGAVEVIAKPFDPMGLPGQVRAILKAVARG